MAQDKGLPIGTMGCLALIFSCTFEYETTPLCFEFRGLPFFLNANGIEMTIFSPRHGTTWKLPKPVPLPTPLPNPLQWRDANPQVFFFHSSCRPSLLSYPARDRKKHSNVAQFFSRPGSLKAPHASTRNIHGMCAHTPVQLNPLPTGRDIYEPTEPLIIFLSLSTIPNCRTSRQTPNHQYLPFHPCRPYHPHASLCLCGQMLSDIVSLTEDALLDVSSLPAC